MTVTKEIYESMTDSGSRFLKHNDNMVLWEEISSEAARDKIGHSLRFANRRKNKNLKRSAASVSSSSSSSNGIVSDACSSTCSSSSANSSRSSSPEPMEAMVEPTPFSTLIAQTPLVDFDVLVQDWKAIEEQLDGGDNYSPLKLPSSIMMNNYCYTTNCSSSSSNNALSLNDAVLLQPNYRVRENVDPLPFLGDDVLDWNLDFDISPSIFA